jgi:hypothetical protein
MTLFLWLRQSNHQFDPRFEASQPGDSFCAQRKNFALLVTAA